MKITKEQIEAIDKAAEKLKGWRDYAAKKHSNVPDCYISLRLSFEARIDNCVDILLIENPALGQDIKSECDKLLRDAQIVDKLYEQSSNNSRSRELEIIGAARRLASRLQQISQNSREEKDAEKPTETTQNAPPSLGGRIVNLFWKLYETTLKVVVDAILEKCWRK